MGNTTERNILVFVYGTLKRGFGNHRLLEDAEFITEAYLERHTMYSLGAFPIIIEGEGVINGELFRVNEEELESLDWLEGYPDFYNRKQVAVHQDNGILWTDVWVYYHEDDRYVNENSLVPTGVW